MAGQGRRCRRAEGEGRPLLVFLHGRGGDEGSYVHGPFFDALDGARP